MKAFLTAVTFASSLALLLASGCGSSSGGTGGTSGSSGTSGNGGSDGTGSGTVNVTCSGTMAMQEVCRTYTNYATTSASGVCTEQGLTVTSACPTKNLTGCCEDQALAGGAKYSQCYYSAPSTIVMSLMTNCTKAQGTWKAK